MTQEEEIRKLIKKMSIAATAGNVDEIMSLFSPDVRAVEFGRLCDNKMLRKNCEEGYAQVVSGFEYHFDLMYISAGEKTAFVYGVERVSGKNSQGIFSEEVYATYGFEKIDGSWLIVHQHLSNKG